MGWKVEGTYFENCNCDWVCPCTVTSLLSQSTGERCEVMVNYHVQRGEVDGVDVSERNVSLIVDAPKNMLAGGWRVGLIIDAAASPDQADKLAAFFGGKLGGPPAVFLPLIGEILGIDRQPIDYRDDGRRHHVRIGGDVAIDVEDYVPHGASEPTRLTGVTHPVSSTLTIARVTSSRIKGFGMEFMNAGKSAFSAPFHWSS